MGCNCQSRCTCTCTSCPTIVTALQINVDWTIPACGASAVLSISNLTAALVGSYIYNTTYGQFRITTVDTSNGTITIINDCLTGNAVPGTPVPSGTLFLFSPPPSNTSVTYFADGTGTNYTLTTSTAPIVFGTTNPAITITLPGTYLVLAWFIPYCAGVTNLAMGQNAIICSLNRTNNTPVALVSEFTPINTQAIMTVYNGALGTVELPPYLYTTLNTTDILTINSRYSGALSAGSFGVGHANITAVKLS